MADFKEVKSVKLAPFTLMTSSISAILAFIAAIVMLVAFGIIAVAIPQATIFGRAITLLGVGLLIIYPIGAFFIYLAVSFFSALLYNGLVPRLGAIKLGLEGNNVNEVPVISFALILATIEAIWALIIGVFLTALIVPGIALLSGSIPVISQAIANATNTTGATLPTGAALGAGGVILALFLIIGLPIIAFIGAFIRNSVGALIYNYIATRVSKVQLEFANISGSLHELKSVPVVPTALSIAIVFLIGGFIIGILNLISYSARGLPLQGVGTLIGDTIGYFVVYFIITAIAAFLYNYLAPKMGGIKLELE